MEDEHPDVRRERRRAEAIAARGTPERLAQIAELEAAQAAAKQKKAKARTSSGRKTPENSTEIFGHPWEEWFAMRDAARAHLDATARAQATTTYGDTWAAIEAALGKELGNRHLAISKLFEYVTTDADTELKMMPTSLALPSGEVDGPEVGFFRLAASLGELEEPVPPVPKGETWTMTDAQRAFWQRCVQAMHDQHRDAPT